MSKQQKVQYLIVKRQEEADVEYKPMMVVDDYKNLHLNYDFEAYQFEADNTFTLVKKYSEYFDVGMALVKWTENQNDEQIGTVLQKWQGRTRNDPIPSDVQELIKSDGEKLAEAYKDVHNHGAFGWQHPKQVGEWYVYGRYYDHHLPIGY